MGGTCPGYAVTRYLTPLWGDLAYGAMKCGMIIGAGKAIEYFEEEGAIDFKELPYGDFISEHKCTFFKALVGFTVIRTIARTVKNL